MKPPSRPSNPPSGGSGKGGDGPGGSGPGDNGSGGDEGEPRKDYNKLIFAGLAAVATSLIANPALAKAVAKVSRSKTHDGG